MYFKTVYILISFCKILLYINFINWSNLEVIGRHRFFLYFIFLFSASKRFVCYLNPKHSIVIFNFFFVSWYVVLRITILFCTDINPFSWSITKRNEMDISFPSIFALNWINPSRVVFKLSFCSGIYNTTRPSFLTRST